MKNHIVLMVFCCLVAIPQAALCADWAQGELKFLPLRHHTTSDEGGNLTVAIDGDDLVFTFKSEKVEVPDLPGDYTMLMVTWLYIGANPPTDPNYMDFPYEHINVLSYEDEFRIPLEGAQLDCGDTVYFSACACIGYSAGCHRHWAYDDGCPEIMEAEEGRYCSVVLPCRVPNGGAVPVLPALALPAALLSLAAVPMMKKGKKR